ncbi:hypothetical protein Tco_0625683 [Tanacetum coccineum]|uniref:Uncharacterized protein n=1 Tax=Tanacetum coccineum TaxID=301880 RepID=A0ABQ4WHH9_9ASTR
MVDSRQLRQALQKHWVYKTRHETAYHPQKPTVRVSDIQTLEDMLRACVMDLVAVDTHRAIEETDEDTSSNFDEEKPYNGWRRRHNSLTVSGCQRDGVWISSDDVRIQIFYDNISLDNRYGLDHFTQYRFSQLNEDEGWSRIEEYVQYQNITWDEPALTMNISSISEIIKPTFEGHLKKAQEQLCYLTTPKGEKSLKNPYLICDICGDAHEVDECYSNGAHEQVCLSEGVIYDDPSFLRFYQNDDIPPWGNMR